MDANPNLGPAEAESRHEVHRASFWVGLWRLADPKVTLASIAGLLLGACAAAAAGPLHWGWLGLTVFGIWCVEIAKNAWGEVVDFDSGCDLRVADEDRSPFSGGKRVLVEGALTRRSTTWIAIICYSLAIASGLVIALYRESGVFALGVVGVALAFFYHAGPVRLSYRGLGELAVFLAYGPLITCGTYLVQHHEIPLGTFLISIPLGMAIAAFLWINEIPDFRADAASAKRNLVVRTGRKTSARVFAAVVGAPYVVLALLPLFGVSEWILLGGFGAPMAATAAIRAWKSPEVAKLIPAQAMTLLAFVVLSLGMGIGLLLAR